jgi:hypothetical protein
MSETNYAHLLRPIGQMLEALGSESFMLKVEGDDFLVQGSKPRRAAKTGRGKIFASGLAAAAR